MGNCFGQTGWSWKISRSNRGDEDPIIDSGADDEDNNENIPNDSSIFRILKFKRRKLNTRKFIHRILRARHSALATHDLDYVEFDRGPQRSQRTTTGADISMQYLDAKSLLMLARGEDTRQMQYREFGMGTANSSQYSSSLDLEWENEYENGTSGGGAEKQNQMMWINIRQPPNVLATVAGHKPLDKSPSSLSSESSEKKDNSIECSAKVHERRTHSWSHISTPDSMEWDVVTEDNQLKSEDCDSVDQDTRDLLFEIEQLKNRALRETGQFDYDLNKFAEEESERS